MLAAVRGALGFLSRLPVGRSEPAWDAFRTTPAAYPVAGAVVGTLVALPLALATLVARETAVAFPPPSTAVATVLAVYAVTGINHVDGVADLGDAAVVHGDAAERREVLKDTRVGVGAVLAVGLVLAGLALGGLALAALPVVQAAAVVVAAEVGAKLGMAVLACRGAAAFEGLGSAVTGPVDGGDLVAPVALALPAALSSFPSLVAAAALAGGPVAALALGRWADARLGGVNGDVLGATNEVGRVVGWHAAAVAATLPSLGVVW